MQNEGPDAVDALFADVGHTMRVSQVAERLGISPQTVKRLISEGRLAAYQPSRDYVFLTDDVKAYLRSTRLN